MQMSTFKQSSASSGRIQRILLHGIHALRETFHLLVDELLHGVRYYFEKEDPIHLLKNVAISWDFKTQV